MAIVVTILLFFVVIVPMFTGDHFAIDTCLDRGGAWDYENRLCLTE